jgi:cell shape-determining protein MreC
MKVHSRHNTKHTRTYRILAVAIVVIIIGLLLPRIFGWVGQVIMFPIHATNQWYSSSEARLPMYLKEQGALIDRIYVLENELAVAASTDLTQQRLYEENVWLRQLLGATTTPRIAAAVIARPTQLPYDLLQIDQGEENGIKVGAPVYIGADNVIGVIVNTAPNYAFAQLFTTPGFSVSAFISGANVMATLDGYGSGVARVRVPQGVPLAVGNLVHVPSLEPGVFGRVEYVENRPSQPEQYGYISMPKPLSGINYVAVGAQTIEVIPSPQIEERVRELIRNSLVLDVTNFNFASSTASSTGTENNTSSL